MARREDQLFIRFRRHGDADALASVFDATAQELLRLARHLAPDDAAEDLVQRTYLDAIQHADRYDANRGVVPWLCGLLAIHARRHRRALQRRRKGNQRLRETPPRRTPDPAATAESAELSAVVRAEIARAGSPYTEVLQLQLEEGLSARAIAERLGRPPGTVRTQLVRGIDRLRQRLVGCAPATIAVTTASTHQVAPLRAAVVAAARRAGPSLVPASTAALGALAMKKLALAIPLVFLATLVGWWAIPTQAPLQRSDPSPDTADLGAATVGSARDNRAAGATPTARRAVSPAGAPRTPAPRPLLARVVALDETPQPERFIVVRDAGRRLASGWTDARGEARFDDVPESARLQCGPVTVSATDAIRSTDAPVVVVLTMPAGKAVRGRVVDAFDQPVAGAAVLGWGGGDRDDGQPLTRSGADGRFEVDELQSKVIEVRKDGFEVGWSGLLAQGADVTVRLRPNDRHLSGIVLAPDGSPAAGARVFVFAYLDRPVTHGDSGGRNFEAAFDADDRGRFAIGWLPAGSGHVVATPGTVDANTTPVWAAMTELGLSGSTRAALTLRGVATGSVRVTIADEHGAPMQRAVARTRASGVVFGMSVPIRASGQTNAEGVATIDGLVAGPHVVTVYRGSDRQERTAEVAPGRTTELAFRWEPARTFALELVDPAGHPHARWRALLRGGGHTTGTILSTTGEDGIAEFEGLAEDVSYSLVVFAPNQPIHPVARRDGIDADTGRMRMQLDESQLQPRSLRGQFVATDGPVTGEAKLVPLGGGLQNTAELTDGAFAFDDMPPGRYRLFLDATDHVMDAREVEISPGADTELPAVTVVAAARLRVACPGLGVQDADKLRVALARTHPAFELTRSSEQAAEWRCGHAMHPGTYRLLVYGTDTLPLDMEVELRPGDQVIQFELPGTATPVALRARLQDTDYGAIARGEVEIEGNGVAIRERFFGHFDDIEEQLAIRRFGLAPGSYEVTVRGMKGETSQTIEVGTVALDVDLAVR